MPCMPFAMAVALSAAAMNMAISWLVMANRASPWGRGTANEIKAEAKSGASLGIHRCAQPPPLGPRSSRRRRAAVGQWLWAKACGPLAVVNPGVCAIFKPGGRFQRWRRHMVDTSLGHRFPASDGHPVGCLAHPCQSSYRTPLCQSCGGSGYESCPPPADGVEIAIVSTYTLEDARAHQARSFIVGRRAPIQAICAIMLSLCARMIWGIDDYDADQTTSPMKARLTVC